MSTLLGLSERRVRRNLGLPQTLNVIHGSIHVGHPHKREKWDHQKREKWDHRVLKKPESLVEARFRRRGKENNDPQNQPAWMVYKDQVLTFEAYFQSPHDGVGTEYRIANILFFPEDGTIQIVEPARANCGSQQGVFLKRHLVLKGDHKGKPRFFTINDLSLGAVLSIYGRDFHIFNCDGFTRKFLASHNLSLGEDAQPPKSTYQPYFGRPEPKHKKVFEEALFLHGINWKQIINIRFLQFDGKVLRFYCTWDDDEGINPDGEPRIFVLYYFLSDHTIQICEIHKRNDGRDPCVVLLKRGNLPKDSKAATTNTGRFGSPPLAYYTDKDLKIGTTINVFGRRFKLCACDKFTERYYETDYGFKQPNFMPKPRGEKVRERKPAVTGPRTNYCKYLKFHGVEYRWRIRFKDPTPLNAVRRFCLIMYPEDDTIKVNEYRIKNSGFMLQRFLRRRRTVNKKTGKTFTIHDIKVGETVNINEFMFEILEEDKSTTRAREEIEEMHRDLEIKAKEHKEAEAREQLKRLEKIRKQEKEDEDRELLRYLKQINNLLRVKLGSISRWIRKMNSRGKNEIRMEEFAAFLKMHYIYVDRKFIKRLWDVFDTSGDGSITIKELFDTIYSSRAVQAKRLRRGGAKEVKSKDKAEPDPSLTQKRDVADTLMERYNVDGTHAMTLASNYIDKGSFSMADLQTVLELKRMSCGERKSGSSQGTIDTKYCR